MPVFSFMIGVPGSGKSTYARLLEKRGAIIVSPDLYRERYRRKSDAEIFAAARAEVALHLKAGRDVVFDATNTIRLHRTENIFAGKPYANRTIAVVMQTPLEECLRRHHERVRNGIRVTLPDEAIARMQRQLDSNPPNLKEGFDEICFVQPDWQTNMPPTL